MERVYSNPIRSTSFYLEGDDQKSEEFNRKKSDVYFTNNDNSSGNSSQNFSANLILIFFKSPQSSKLFHFVILFSWVSFFKCNENWRRNSRNLSEKSIFTPNKKNMITQKKMKARRLIELKWNRLRICVESLWHDFHWRYAQKKTVSKQNVFICLAINVLTFSIQLW